MIITITSDYLWLGVSRKAEVRKLHFFCNNKKIKEIDIRLTDEEPEYYVSADLSRFAGQKLEITGDFPEDLFKGIHLSDEKPVNTYAYRPVLHFTPETGLHWILCGIYGAVWILLSAADSSKPLPGLLFLTKLHGRNQEMLITAAAITKNSALPF